MFRPTRRRAALLLALPLTVLLLPSMAWRYFVVACHAIGGVVTYAEQSCRGGDGAPGIEQAPWLVPPSPTVVVAALALASALVALFRLRDRRRDGGAPTT